MTHLVKFIARYKSIIALLVLIFATGCMVIPKGRLNTKHSPASLGPDQKKSEISYTVETVDVSNPTTGYPWWFLSSTEASMLISEELESSGYFTRVMEGEYKGNIHASMRIEFSLSPYVFGVASITGMSLGLIPTWMTHDFKMIVTVHFEDGKTEHYIFRDQCVEYRWLPFIFASPFAWITTAAKDMTSDATRYFVARLIADGSLPISAQNYKEPRNSDPQPNDRNDINHPSPEVVKATGTGFFVSRNGYLLTNYHVVKNSDRIEVYHARKVYSASIISADTVNDVALLKVEGNFDALTVADDFPSKLGDHVFTIGYPNPSLQGMAPKYTGGEISSLSGLGGDIRMFQISVPVQPGNSGGPLVNEKGQTIGIIVSRLDDLYTLQRSGSLPQNVNYAVKSSYILPLLKQNSVVVSSLPETSIKDDQIKLTEKATVLIIVY